MPLRNKNNFIISVWKSLKLKKLLRAIPKIRFLYILCKIYVDDYERKRTMAFAKKITSCPEFRMLKFHPLAGKIKGDKQYFFDGSFTTFPWASENLHLLIELTNGATEPQVIVPFLNILKKLPGDAVMIELGAYWAFYSILFGKRLPKAKMILVEANPHSLKITKKNIERNGLLERSTIIHGAVTDRDDEIICFGDSSIQSDGKYQVSTISVDGIMKKLGLSRVDLVHMDVQGAEESVIQGMVKVLANKAIDYIFIGTHSNDLHTTCEALLNRAGYRTLVSINRDKSVSDEGILVSTRPGL